MRVIKRYPNRKLYDTENKEYITLDGIADLIREGAEIQVVDNASGEDLTTVTLTQIIFDQEKRKSGFLPRSVLADLIQIGGSRLSALQRSLLTQMGFLHQVDEEIKNRVQFLVSRGEIAEVEAARLVDKLLSAGNQVLGATSLPTQMEFERVLDRLQVPTKHDMENLLGQLDAVMAKLATIKSHDTTSQQRDD